MSHIRSGYVSCYTSLYVCCTFCAVGATVLTHLLMSKTVPERTCQRWIQLHWNYFLHQGLGLMLNRIQLSRISTSYIQIETLSIWRIEYFFLNHMVSILWCVSIFVIRRPSFGLNMDQYSSISPQIRKKVIMGTSDIIAIK